MWLHVANIYGVVLAECMFVCSWSHSWHLQPLSGIPCLKILGLPLGLEAPSKQACMHRLGGSFLGGGV